MVGERYELLSSLESSALTSSWKAQDRTLDREIFLRVLSAEHSHADAVLDAARQAAAVTDHRLARILDIGQDDTGSFVVYEWLAGPSLEVQLISGPLPSAQVRAIIGECAQALEVAGQRGVHHLGLSPAQVFLLPDGSIRITELAVAAALSGIDFTDSQWSGTQAAQRDARDIVALCYAALTARWPLARGSGPMSLLAQAPLVQGHPAAPIQIVADVPTDLDTLCSQTFGGSGPPATPGLVAQAIAPWQVSSPRASPAEPKDRSAATVMLPAVTMPSTAGIPQPAPGPGTAVFTTFAGQEVQPPAEPQWQPSRDARDVTPHNSRRNTSQTGAVLGIFAFFIVFISVLAYFGLRDFGGGFSFADKDPATQARDLPSASKSTKPATAAGQPLAIASGRGFDPEGDQTENDDRVARAFDGNPSTNWGSKTYKTEVFGSLKTGVGIEISLKSAGLVSQLDLQGVPAGVTLQVRPAEGENLSTRVLASGTSAGDRLQLQLSEPLETQSLILWCIKPAAVSGGFRVEIGEVAIS